MQERDVNEKPGQEKGGAHAAQIMIPGIHADERVLKSLATRGFHVGPRGQPEKQSGPNRRSPMISQIHAGVTLRKTEGCDRSAPNLTMSDAQESIDAFKHESTFLDVGMSHWLPLVDDLTFATESMPLTIADAELLCACHRHLHGGADPQTTLDADQVRALASLGHRLGPLLVRLGAAKDGGVFTKLSGRSAKDAPLHTQRLDEELARRSSGTRDTDAALAHLFDAALTLAKVKDPAHALWLLVNSSRVEEDLDVALRHPERWDQALVVRTWWPGMSSDLEFRMFVHDGEATGVTQYNQLLFSPRVAGRGAVIAGALKRYFDEVVRPRLRGTRFEATVGGRYACDLALHPDALVSLDAAVAAGESPPLLGRDQVQLVELNAFYEATGMGLFDYERDQHALTHGPFQWRVLTTPPPKLEVKLERQWREVIRSSVRQEGGGAPERRHTDAAWRQLDEAMRAPEPAAAQR